MLRRFSLRLSQYKALPAGWVVGLIGTVWSFSSLHTSTWLWVKGHESRLETGGWT